MSGIKKDIDKLGGYNRSYIVAILFSFEGGPDWTPYSHKGNIEQLVKEVVSGIGTPVYEGQAQFGVGARSAMNGRLLCPRLSEGSLAEGTEPTRSCDFG